MSNIEKDLDEIKNIVNDFLFPFELECEIGEDFAYYPFHDLIEISLVTIDRSSKNFLSFVNTEFNDITADIFLWSLLHEIGHHETWDILTDSEIIESQIIKKQIQNNEIDSNRKDEIYFYTPDEYAATEWAANYMKENVQEVKEFWEKLQPHIINLYEKYNVER